jgi:hypothetical protein
MFLVMILDIVGDRQSFFCDHRPKKEGNQIKKKLTKKRVFFVKNDQKFGQ